ncbi:GNAT family N-acetyltransferase [Flavihumibacter sp. R14]|nr:GNAT family N-acetyltransferase [Flavihumibacter soli]
MEAIIRRPVEDEIPRLWELMHGLAVFEKYENSFRITPEIVLAKGFRKDPPDFYSFIAEAGGRIAGMVVYYFIAYTAENRPSIYIKELFVDEDFRGLKIGEMLMKAVAGEAETYDCASIKWTVARWNADGMRFYERLGARENRDWLNYQLSDEDFRKLL